MEGRPPAQHVAGLTDRRFEGQIVKYLADKGYGFIRCNELRSGMYPDRDIFLHHKQLGNFKEGDTVSFGIILNRDNKPTATELALLNGGGAAQPQQPAMQPQGVQYGEYGMQQQAMQQQQQQQSMQYGMQQAAVQQPAVQQAAMQQPAMQQYGMQQQGMQQYGMQQQGMQQYGMQGYGGGNYDQAAWEEWPPKPQEEEDTHEVEVPRDLVCHLEGGRLHQLKYMAGGDIQIAFQTKSEHGNPVAVVKGPKAHASLGAILVMQDLCDLVQIPA